MIITAIERQRKRRGRVEVWVDGGLRFDVSSALAKSRGLRPGATIEATEIETIVALDARRAAMQVATSMLARRPHSEREVRRRLATVARCWTELGRDLGGDPHIDDLVEPME